MYYVYVYLDSRKKGKYVYDNIQFDYEPFYIGKGKNNRDICHLEKCKTITKGSYYFYDKLNFMINNNCYPIIQRLKYFDDEADALEYEKTIIKLIGKIVNGGTLVNLTNGGIGGDTFSNHNNEKKLEIKYKMSLSNKGKNTGKKCPEHQKQLLHNLYIGIKNPDHSKKMKDRFLINENRLEIAFKKLKDKTEWDKKIEQYDKHGNLIKIWNNYRDIKEAGFNSLYILKKCRTNSKEWKWKN